MYSSKQRRELAMKLLICQTPDCWAPATTRDTETKTIYCLRCGGIHAANRIIEKDGLAGLRLEAIHTT